MNEKTPAELTAHAVDSFNRDYIQVNRVEGLGDPCVEGRVYFVEVWPTHNHPPIFPEECAVVLTLEFQKGLVTEVGPNGISIEALLAVCLDRLECFQRGAYRCRENALAITKIEEALHWLGAREPIEAATGVGSRRHA